MVSSDILDVPFVMKLVAVYSSPESAQAHLLANLLQSDGIDAVIVGEPLSAMIGYLPAVPTQVCVREEDVDRVRPIVARFVAAGKVTLPSDATPWTCPNCGETIEAQFTDCWKCQTPRPDGDGHVEAPQPERPAPDPQIPIDVECRGCRYNLRTLSIEGRCPECGHPIFPSVMDKVRALEAVLEPLEWPATDVLRPCLDWFERHLGFPLEAVTFAEYVWRDSGRRDIEMLPVAMQEKAAIFFGDAMTARRALERWNVRSTSDLRRLISSLVELRVLTDAQHAR